MSESKVFMFPESGASNGELVSLLSPLLQQRGIETKMDKILTLLSKGETK